MKFIHSFVVNICEAGEGESRKFMINEFSRMSKDGEKLLLIKKELKEHSEI